MLNKIFIWGFWVHITTSSQKYYYFSQFLSSYFFILFFGEFSPVLQLWDLFNTGLVKKWNESWWKKGAIICFIGWPTTCTYLCDISSGPWKDGRKIFVRKLYLNKTCLNPYSRSWCNYTGYILNKRTNKLPLPHNRCCAHLSRIGLAYIFF